MSYEGLKFIKVNAGEKKEKKKKTQRTSKQKKPEYSLKNLCMVDVLIPSNNHSRAS